MFLWLVYFIVLKCEPIDWEYNICHLGGGDDEDA